MNHRITNLFCALLIAGVFAPRVNAELLQAFDPTNGEFPESVAPDHRGNVYVSLTGSRGEIRRLDREGEMQSFFQLDPAPVESFGILGLATDHYGHVYAAIASFHPATHGVWQIDPDGSGFRIPGSEDILMPNDLDFDRHGNLYVTDTMMGAVWRIGTTQPEGRPVELWIQHDLLLASGPVNPNVDLGANGIAIKGSEVYVAVTEGARVVRIDISPDGSAGTPTVFAQHPDLLLIDGLDFDHRGRLYGAIVALRAQELGRIMHIRHDAAPEPVLGPGDGLQLPTNLAFANTQRGRGKVYVANWDIAADRLGIEPKPALHSFRLEPMQPMPERAAPDQCFRTPRSEPSE